MRKITWLSDGSAEEGAAALASKDHENMVNK